MANQFEGVLGTFEIKRLRSLDAAFLEGANRPLTGPAPIVAAEGPGQIIGPQAGAVGNGETWSFSIEIPALPDIVWVFTSDNIVLASETATGAPTYCFLLPVTDSTYNTIQMLVAGPGQMYPIAQQGGYLETAMVPITPRPRTFWYPIDPLVTKGGFAMRVIMQADTNGLSQDQHNVHMRGVRYLGYPVNAWGTAWLEDQVRQRGS